MRVSPGQTVNASTNACGRTNACDTGKAITSNTSGQGMEKPIYDGMRTATPFPQQKKVTW